MGRAACHGEEGAGIVGGVDIRLADLFPEGTAVCNLPAFGPVRLAVVGGTSPVRRFLDAEFYPASRATARVARFGLRAIAAAGAGRVVAAGSTPGEMLSHLAGKVGAEGGLVVRSGTSGPGQKIVARLLGDDGHVVAYAKLGASAVARSLIGNERLMLESLADPIAPRVLAFLEDGEWACLALSPHAGRPLRLASPMPTQFDAALAAHAGEAAPTYEHPWLMRLAAREPAAVQAAAGGLVRRESWPVSPYHGDCAPWNLLRDKGGALHVVDWEFGEREGLPGVDRAHYALATGRLVRRLDAAQAVRRSTAVLAAREGAPDAGFACELVLLAAASVRARLAGYESSAVAGELAWWSAAVDAALDQLHAKAQR